MNATRPHMPGYGVPADEGEGLLPFEWAEERLRDARNYWVGTVTPETVIGLIEAEERFASTATRWTFP